YAARGLRRASQQVGRKRHGQAALQGLGATSRLARRAPAIAERSRRSRPQRAGPSRSGIVSSTMSTHPSVTIGIDLGTTHCALCLEAEGGESSAFGVPQLVARSTVEAPALLP